MSRQNSVQQLVLEACCTLANTVSLEEGKKSSMSWSHGCQGDLSPFQKETILQCSLISLMNERRFCLIKKVENVACSMLTVILKEGSWKTREGVYFNAKNSCV